VSNVMRTTVNQQLCNANEPADEMPGNPLATAVGKIGVGP
jgi:hypothetical protein